MAAAAPRQSVERAAAGGCAGRPAQLPWGWRPPAAAHAPCEGGTRGGAWAGDASCKGSALGGFTIGARNGSCADYQSTPLRKLRRLPKQPPCTSHTPQPNPLLPATAPELLHRLRQVPHLAAAEVAVARLPRARLAAVHRLGQCEVDAPRLRVRYRTWQSFQSRVLCSARASRCERGGVQAGTEQPSNEPPAHVLACHAQPSHRLQERTRVPRLNSVPTSMSDVSTSFSPQLQRWK